MTSLPLRFIVAAYGRRYSGMLLTWIYAVRTTHPDASVTVLWKDMPRERIDAIRKAFPEVEFVESDKLFDANSAARIAQKTHLWRAAAQLHPDATRILMDVDALPVKRLEKFFDEGDFDIGFTRKSDLYPLNTGVMLARGRKATAFFDEWMEQTDAVLKDPDMMRQATSRDYLYGAPDQMSFYQFIGYDERKTEFSGTTKDGTLVRFRAFPCAVLNFVHSSPITPEMHVIHFKSGLQHILTDGTGFTGKRTRKDSWDMYLYYLKLYKGAVDRVRERTGTKGSYREFGIVIPFYMSSSLTVRPALYAVFSAKEWIRMKAVNLYWRFRKFLKSMVLRKMPVS